MSAGFGELTWLSMLTEYVKWVELSMLTWLSELSELTGLSLVE